MNPYVGLEEYISWDSCGIERGKFLTEKEFGKLTEAAQGECKPHTYMSEKGDEVTLYFQPSATARKLCVRHLNDAVPINELFTPKVITHDVLLQLEPIIARDFSYGTDEATQEELTTIFADGE